MKNRAKLTVLAAVAIQALLTLLPISASAITETVHEIGMPQPIEEPVRGCFGAVLAPDGERFYTVHDSGVITQYRINPFKKLGTVAFDRKRLKESPCHVLITNDEKKLIIRFSNKLLLIDASSGQALNVYLPMGYGQQGTISNAIMNDGELILIEGFLVDEERWIYDLVVLDANTLARKRGIGNLARVFAIPKGEGFPYLNKYLDKIYFAWSSYLVVVLNSKTYNPELSLFSQGGGTGWPSPKISHDHQTLYAKNVYKVIDHLTGKATNHEVREWRDEVLSFDQKTRAARIDDTKNIPTERIERLISTPGTSRAKDYLMATGRRSFSTAGLANLVTAARYRLHQYESGEAILTEQISSKEPMYFQFTPGARKYLMMKNREGKVVPIDDATFAKYYRKEF